MSRSRGRKPRAAVRALPDTGRALLEFLRTEAGGGAVLLAAALAALVWANSPWESAYHELWHHEISVGSGDWAMRETVGHWINDGLMVLFFFVVGLEIKRELVCGELLDRRAAALPVVAAAGGMVAPVALFWLVSGGGVTAHGWGIPMATDIAFAVGVLALLGSRVPRPLKVFLLTLAIVDDIGAIAVIAVFYSARLEPAWLLGAAALLGFAMVARRLERAWIVAFVPIAVLVWYCTYRSGIHPTIAGVALGLLTPVASVGERPVLEQLETRLHPWSSYVVIPVFALANAGVSLDGGSLGDALRSRLTWAVVIGLVAGKLVGIAGPTMVMARSPLGQLPAGVGLRHVVGAGALGGIGFTVSLFITGLAFSDPALQAQAKIGILAGSMVAALVGAAVLTQGASAD
ncbi:MAG TPA: Na+/H+ antiporter NhaA [Acidimicrobiia bacterium]|nr:Na+/H+ antiporter NhaA [Acidimicrobiia bacterium]